LEALEKSVSNEIVCGLLAVVGYIIITYKFVINYRNDDKYMMYNNSLNCTFISANCLKAAFCCQ